MATLALGLNGRNTSVSDKAAPLPAEQAADEKVDVKGQQVWICCNGCREELLANPDKYLAMLNKG